MTTGSIIWFLAIGGLFYFMVKNGGGCCGGHNRNNGHSGNHGDHKANKGENPPASGLDEHSLEDRKIRAQLVEKDPVCGMAVNDTDVVPASEHLGMTFRFCSERCKKLFELHPNKYVAQQQ